MGSNLFFELFTKETASSELEPLAKLLRTEGVELFVPVDEGFSSRCCLESPSSLYLWMFSFCGK